MIRISDTITLEDWELTEQFTRSSGPGGQNVNKVSTADELRFEAARAQSARSGEEAAKAVTSSQLKKIVAPSSIGAGKISGTGWIAMNRGLETRLSQTGIPVVFLRAAYFMENWAPLVQAAATHGELCKDGIVVSFALCGICNRKRGEPGRAVTPSPDAYPQG